MCIEIQAQKNNNPAGQQKNKTESRKQKNEN